MATLRTTIRLKTHQINLPQTHKREGHLTGLGDEEEHHEDGGDDRDDTAGERPLVEVLIHLGVRVQALEPMQERLHPFPLRAAAAGRQHAREP
jgi:hypothetical protein